jgi:transcriptional regulatory protein LevR
MAGKNKVYKGDDWEFDFQYKLNGEATDITGATEIKACLKDELGTTPVEVLLTSAEIIVSNAPAGIGKIKFPKAKTLLSKKGTQNLQVTLTDSSGDESTIVQEKFLEVIEKDC